jgi:phosphoribosylamine--glycine ligase
MQPAQDFKRAFDGDQGPNTGGMGAYSPLPWAPKNIMEETLERVLQPTVDAMAGRGTPFVGLLYAGLALTDQGIKVIEFNARFGDPETQVLLPRLKTPLAQLLYQAATGTLHEAPTLQWSEDSAVTVVLASEGYPASPKFGEPIIGINPVDGSAVFHAATTLDGTSLKSSGGRVLSITGVGSDLKEARDKAYRVLTRVSLQGSYYRSDIALNASIAEKGN